MRRAKIEIPPEFRNLPVSPMAAVFLRWRIQFPGLPPQSGRSMRDADQQYEFPAGESLSGKLLSDARPSGWAAGTL